MKNSKILEIIEKIEQVATVTLSILLFHQESNETQITAAFNE